MKRLKGYRFKYVILFIFVGIISFVGCENNGEKSDYKSKESKEVTIKFLSNLPERTSGQGKLEQLLIDRYMQENPNVKVEVEAYQDEPYKQRFKAYAICNELPDIFFIWGQPSFFNPVMQGGYASELNLDYFYKNNFSEDSLKGFKMNDKLYGIPKSTDYMVLYCNKDVFSKLNLKIPSNYEELIDSCRKLRSSGINPIAMNMKDKWPMALLYQELVLMEGNNQALIYKAINGDIKFSGNETLKKAAEDLQELLEVNGDINLSTSEDYNLSMNLFTQEKAAMYYMGSWELGMYNNPALSDRFKKNITAIKFPQKNNNDEKGLIAWNGGGYAISAKSTVKDEAMKLLEYMMRADNWPKSGLEMGLIVPAQRYQGELDFKESPLQKELAKILSNSTSISGTSWHDSMTPDFKTVSEELSYELAAGIISPDNFLSQMDQEVAKEKINK
ncbi:ABC transporter substrate-binding protein [Clostridium sp. YIM B02551]|uniref:ABC transporter substrate-binding protein n=1 Tax=Clostridium sp. YIM B02551 TaxID=2910679 RepID=UPI001EE9DD88|nr:extracellular solute-binding protein [Clostridium sp. YIM B02551]